MAYLDGKSPSETGGTLILNSALSITIFEKLKSLTKFLKNSFIYDGRKDQPSIFKDIQRGILRHSANDSKTSFHYIGRAIDINDTNSKNLVYSFFSLWEQTEELKKYKVCAVYLSLHNRHIHISLSYDGKEVDNVKFGFEKKALFGGISYLIESRYNLTSETKQAIETMYGFNTPEEQSLLYNIIMGKPAPSVESVKSDLKIFSGMMLFFIIALFFIFKRGK